jgi:hypothetical protein
VWIGIRLLPDFGSARFAGDLEKVVPVYTGHHCRQIGVPRGGFNDRPARDETKYTAQIDTVGRIFVAFVVVITAIAAMVAYHGNNTMVAKTSLPHLVGPPS